MGLLDHVFDALLHRKRRHHYDPHYDPHYDHHYDPHYDPYYDPRSAPVQPRMVAQPNVTAQAICRECRTPVAADAGFCSRCGAAQSRPVSATICLACGSQSPPGAQYCSSCGVGLRS